MKKILILLFMVVGLLIIGCQNNASETAVPTEAPAPAAPPEEPTTEATAVAVVDAEPDYLQPRYEPLPPDKCFIYPPEDVELTVDYDCGYVVVPEFYQGETNRIVKVPFVRFNSPNGTTASPLLLHPGGPGQAHINELTFGLFNAMFDGVIPDRDVIFMDPRGTEHADTFLDCPAFYSLPWQAHEQGLDEEASKALVIETVQTCMDDFQAQGVNLDAYNSLELAGDVNSVRQALGYEQIIYFGTSYGSILGQHLMRDYPEILEAVILNGSSPLSRQSWIEDRALDNQVAFDNLVALCTADEKCNEAYPDIPGLLDAALAHFDDGPLPYTYTDPNDPSLTIEGEVDASNLAGFILALQGDKNAVFSIPSFLTSLAPADQKETVVATLGPVSGQGIIASRDATKGPEALLMHLAVVCSDDMVRSEDEIILDGASQFAIDNARATATTYTLLCPLLGVPELPDGTDENVTVDIPTLLLSGSLDVSTPPVRSQLIADALPNATHVIFSGHIHDQLGSLSPCVKDVYTQFIADPSQTPDTTCTETPDYIGFLLPDGTYSLAPAEDADADEAATGDALLTNSWQWTSFTNPAEQFDIDTPQNYVLTFYEDGTVTIVADCNTVLGTYGTDAGAMTIELGPATLAACPPESRSDQFTQYLSSAARYFLEDGNLYIDLMADGGTMTFAPVDLEGLVDENAIISSLPADIVTQLDAYLQSQVYTDGGNPELAAPGLVLLVDTPDGRYLNSAGVSNLADGDLMQVDDILQIGSNTKSMTIVLLMQLVEEGQLTLDDTLDQWLPEQAALFENSDQMTLRRLAQHTAGLWDYGDDIIGGGVSDPALLEASYTPAELVQYAADKGTPYFDPGAEGQWKYSNTGYILLGMIIEKVTGQPISDLYQTRIFDPLGMESAVFLEGVPQEGQITTHGYWFENGEIIDTTNWNASQGWVAGAAAMTATDLATYARGLANGQLFQNPETLNEMLTFDPAAKFGVGGPYGLGLIDFAGDGTVWGHGGQTLGFQSLWYIQPETGTVVVGLTNSASYSSNAFLNVLNILEGKGAQPFGPWTLTPLGELLGTTWTWKQFTNPAAAVDIDEAAALSIVISKNSTVAVSSAACGEAYGTYTSMGMGNISFDMDDSSWTCTDDSPAGQFIDYLSQATSWSFNNGNLLIELPADGGTLIFTYVSLQ